MMGAAAGCWLAVGGGLAKNCTGCENNPWVSDQEGGGHRKEMCACVSWTCLLQHEWHHARKEAGGVGVCVSATKLVADTAGWVGDHSWARKRPFSPRCGAVRASAWQQCQKLPHRQGSMTGGMLSAMLSCLRWRCRWGVLDQDISCGLLIRCLPDSVRVLVCAALLWGGHEGREVIRF